MLEVLARIRHRRIRRQLSPYLDGMLSERESRRLETHLAQCRACRDELAELQAAVQALAELPLVESPRSFALTAAPRRAEAPRPAARRLEFGLRLATAAAAFVLAIVAAGDLVGRTGEEEEDREAVAQMDVASRASGTLTAEAQPSGKAQDNATAAPTLSAPATGPVTGSPPAGMGGGEEGTPSSEASVPNPSVPPKAAVPGIAEPGAPAATATVAATAAPAAAATGSETPPAETPVPGETPSPTEMPPGLLGPAGTPQFAAPAPTQEAPPATVTPLPVSANVAPSESVQPPSIESRAPAQAEQKALAENEGGPSRETVLRWLEIGLAASLALLFVSWVLARRRSRA